MSAKTLFEKIWDAHVIVERDDGQSLLYVDRHLIHDLHYKRFSTLEAQGRTVRRPDLTFASPDHSMPTDVTRVEDIVDDEMRTTVAGLEDYAKKHNVTLFPLSDERHGIVHVVGPEQGITLPGIFLVCGDSHTSTHGALGCISIGIGSSEVGHVLATQAIWQRKPKTMRVNVEGSLSSNVYGKDIILALIRQISAAGGTGHAIEYAGSAIRSLSMDGRMTVCNMTIEAGARTGMVAPDQTTFDYVFGRPFAPAGPAWDRALAHWRTLPSDADATFDTEVHVDVNTLAPMVTWGTSPENAIQINETIPDPANEPDAERRAGLEAALEYMALRPGMSMCDVPIDRVFIGACTNSRIEDLRAAAAVAKGRKAKVRTLVVPGSGLVKKAAQAEGLDRIFVEAGMEWREPGCSMCVAMNGDTLGEGERSASTSNRNFRGRQGLGSRTHLVSPAMAAAAAVTGYFADVRDLVEGD
ncbi:MAG: 3-isopropylmalate/(R)-2-methylmalate dehydratase large subunit [Gammaproteobacteria bacterium]|jgi:3-isopropylmalate/(R)-2-methylmalate dehydratase large subunit